MEAAVTSVVRDSGRLDVMTANAGILSKAGGLDGTVADWDRVRAVDFDGAYYCARAAGLVFKAQGYGNCIFTASMSGHAANDPQEQSCYNACKAGVIHLSKSLAVEWANWGGRVNSVSPGYIDTAISRDCPFEMKEAWYDLTPLRSGETQIRKNRRKYISISRAMRAPILLERAAGRADRKSVV